MAKIKWTVIRPEYGPQCTVVAPTRSQALAMAEAYWLDMTRLPGISAEPVPEFVVRKVGRATGEVGASMYDWS